MPQEAPRCHLEECWRQDEEAVPPGQAPAESCGSWPVWGAAGFYGVGTPDWFWGAKTRHCFGLICEDSKLKPSPGCNQRNQAHLKLFKHIHFPPGGTCLPWLTSYSRQACLGAAFESSYSLCSCLQSLCPSLVVSPGDTLKQLLGSDSAVIFLSYSPQRATKEEAISPALVGRKRRLLTLFFLAQNAFPGVVCSAVHTCVSTQSEYVDSCGLLWPSHLSPAFASLEPGCFQPGFYSIELSPALLPLLRTTWFLCRHLVLRQDTQVLRKARPLSTSFLSD